MLKDFFQNKNSVTNIIFFFLVLLKKLHNFKVKILAASSDKLCNILKPHNTWQHNNA